MLPWLQHRWTSLYLLLMALGALFLFLYGFFPIKYHAGRNAQYPEDLPNFIDGVSIDGQQVYSPGETSVVLMVIDGMRYDFATEEYMPYLGQLLRNKSACIYVSVAEPPTVTMPRIKAMMTGSVSTFADVALNFGAPAVHGDSVLRAAAARGRRSVMYGDDTWLRLFPGMWAESDGTTSFYVTDYTEVDNNVTRHLDKVLAPGEKNAPSFDFLVLHYLGLDHIGHLEGARSAKIKPKLLEMDAVVKKIYEGMQKWDRTGVLLVCGDHGMRDAGGHGGATPAEVLVPLVVARTNDFQCPYPHLSRGPLVAQVDLAPTIAWLLNAPVPGDSTGRPLPSLLPADTRQHLYLLHYVAKRNAEAARAQIGPDVVEKEFYKQFQRAEKQFAQYLATGHQMAAKISKEFYEEALDKLAEILTKSTVNFDVFAIVTAIVLLYTITASLICVMLYSFQMDIRRTSVISHRHNRTQAGAILAFFIILCCATVILTLSCAITETSSSLCSLNPIWIPAFIALAVAFTVTFFLTKTAIEQNFDLTAFKELNAIDHLLIVGTLFHAWSFFGTSFIEEEQMTWYFFWNTLMFFAFIRTLVVVVIYVSKKVTGATEIQDKPILREKMITGVGILPKWVVLIALHRYLRTMNQTGDRWLFLPDTADWLNAPENSLYLQAHLIIGTLLTLIVCLNNLRFSNNYLRFHTVLTIAATATILAYRVSSNTLEPRFFPTPPTWDTVYIVNVFWAILAVQIVFEILTYVGIKSKTGQGLDSHRFVYNKPKAKTEDYTFADEEPWNSDEVKLNLARSISHILLNDMMLIVALLMRPHNVIMVSSVYFTCHLTSKCLDHKLLDPLASKKTEVLDILSETLAHLWIGSVFFFYQGNSNSLASVDLGAGYVGLRAYCPARVAVRMGLHAYAGPALAGAALFARRAAQAKTWTHYLHTVWQTTNIFALQRVYSLSVYTVVAAVFKDHLFVWTVFSPKLLYDFVGTVFTIQALFTIAEVIGLTQFTARLAKAVTFKTVP